MRDDLMIGEHVIFVPASLGRCIHCGEQSWMTNAAGRPAHPCCEAAAPEECEACQVSAALERTAVQRRESYARLRKARGAF